MDRQVKYVLQESEMPREWYNVIADLPSPPPPPLHPGTRQPVGPDAGEKADALHEFPSGVRVPDDGGSVSTPGGA